MPPQQNEAELNVDEIVVERYDDFQTFKEDDTVQGSYDTSKSIERLSKDDLEMLRRLNNEYKRVMEESQISTIAKFQSIRQTAVIIAATMFTSLCLGTWFVRYKAETSIAEAVLFTAYTITSAGFGTVLIPKTDPFLFFAIAYVFIGITLLALLVAQVFQYLEVTATRFNNMSDKVENKGKAVQSLRTLIDGEKDKDSLDYKIRKELVGSLKNSRQYLSKVDPKHSLRNVYARLRRNPCLSALVVPCYLLLLLTIGATTMCYLEGWTPVQGIYFAVFAMSTVGYGDIAPTTPASTWFVSFWLPFNVSFLALYLGTVAHYYVKLSNWNVRRIEKQLELEERKPKKKQKVVVVKMRSLRARGDIDGEHVFGGVNTGLESLATASHFGKPAAQSIDGNEKPVEKLAGIDIEQGKEVELAGVDIEQGKAGDDERTFEFDLAALFEKPLKKEEPPEKEEQPVVETARPRRRRKKQISKLSFEGDDKQGLVSVNTTKDLLHFLGVIPNAGGRTNTVIPAGTENFALTLRFRVLQRLARIVAAESQGPETTYDVRGNDLTVMIDELRAVAEKWHIPHRARETFRDVYCKAMLFVGERAVITRGVDAFFDLNPFEFSDIFSPFVAAFEDFETMEGWLASTEVLASIHLRRDTARLSPLLEEQSEDFRRSKRAMKNTIEEYFPCNPGNAVLMHVLAST